jgi:hypothetical protein
MISETGVHPNVLSIKAGGFDTFPSFMEYAVRVSLLHGVPNDLDFEDSRAAEPGIYRS